MGHQHEPPPSQETRVYFIYVIYVIYLICVHSFLFQLFSIIYLFIDKPTVEFCFVIKVASTQLSH